MFPVIAALSLLVYPFFIFWEERNRKRVGRARFRLDDPNRKLWLFGAAFWWALVVLKFYVAYSAADSVIEADELALQVLFLNMAFGMFLQALQMTTLGEHGFLCAGLFYPWNRVDSYEHAHGDITLRVKKENRDPAFFRISSDGDLDEEIIQFLEKTGINHSTS